MKGVENVVRILKFYKLVSCDFYFEDIVIFIKGVDIGGKEFVVMGGLCVVEFVV